MSNKDILIIKEKIQANAKEFSLIKEYVEFKYAALIEALAWNNDKAMDDLLKGEARAYKTIVDLLS